MVEKVKIQTYADLSPQPVTPSVDLSTVWTGNHPAAAEIGTRPQPTVKSEVDIVQNFIFCIKDGLETKERILLQRHATMKFFPVETVISTINLLPPCVRRRSFHACNPCSGGFGLLLELVVCLS